MEFNKKKPFKNISGLYTRDTVGMTKYGCSLGCYGCTGVPSCNNKTFNEFSYLLLLFAI